jgi:hypothetical protein
VAKKKPVAKAKKPVAPVAKKVTKVTNEEEAKAVVKKNLPDSPGNVEYVVLENCNIFYGINKAAALKYAKTFDLKYFEIKA